jgi:hypothetical protein
MLRLHRSDHPRGDIYNNIVGKNILFTSVVHRHLRYNMASQGLEVRQPYFWSYGQMCMFVPP